jgi:hypothetical protein
MATTQFQFWFNSKEKPILLVKFQWQFSFGTFGGKTQELNFITQPEPDKIQELNNADIRPILKLV